MDPVIQLHRKLGLAAASAAFLILSGSSCEKELSGVHSLSVRGEEPNLQEDLKLPLRNARITVYKSKRELELFADDKLVRRYRVGLGFNAIDDKQREGDGCTPEGDFYIFTRNSKSAYYLSLGISYPNIEDADRGLRDGLISKPQHRQILKTNRDKTTPPQYTPLGA